jgi:hypothetical protein
MPDAAAAPYLAGDKRAYILVGGKHQYFPRREMDTLRYSTLEPSPLNRETPKCRFSTPGLGRSSCLHLL